MATSAQIEANRQNSKQSTGPRTQDGKNRSRANALDHGFRANILVLPSEQFGEFEDELHGWRLSFRPRNPTEEFLIERIVRLGCQSKRIQEAETARLASRMHSGKLDEEAEVDASVLELGQKLFQDACGPQALHLQDPSGEATEDEEPRRISDYRVPEDHPVRLVNRLQRTGTGCQWLLDQWAVLRGLLERGIPWLAADQLKAVRLLGRHPIDVLDSKVVAEVYLASHVLLNRDGQPFQEVLNELSPDEATRLEGYLRLRRYHELAPKDAAAARRVLMDIIDRTTAVLEESAGVYRELAAIDLETAAHRLSWDDTAEGERLRRYETSCRRDWNRTFDLLLRIRRTGEELDIASIAPRSRSASTIKAAATLTPAPIVADVVIPVAQPDPEPEPAIEATSMPAPAPNEPNSEPVKAPNEPNSEPVKAPNEPNLTAQTTTGAGRENHKELRIDKPHLDRKVAGIRPSGNERYNPALERFENSRGSLLNLSSILGK